MDEALEKRIAERLDAGDYDAALTAIEEGYGPEIIELRGRSGYLVTTVSAPHLHKVSWRKGWRVPTLVQTGPEKFRDGERTVLHKMPVVVTELAQAVGNFYNHTYTVVEVEMRDGTRTWVDSSSFSLRPYWACPPREGHYLDQIQTGSWVIKMAPGAKAVDSSSGEWFDINADHYLICRGTLRTGPPPYVECDVLDAADQGTGVTARVRPQDMIVVY